MRILRSMLSRRWIAATLLAAVGAAVCFRLGIWQLDRLEQRRLFNARVEAQINEPQLELAGEALRVDLYNMEYRQVRAAGEYDFSSQIALRNQYWGNEWGAHLVTPLILEGSDEVVLVDRGWIPAANFESGDWAKFDEPGRVEVLGIIRRPQSKAELGSRSDQVPAAGAEALKAWYFINISAISQQVPYPLLPVYIQQAPQADRDSLPYRSQPELELSEGPHMGYALQWFSFAGLLILGYPYFIRRQGNKRIPIERSEGKASATGGPHSRTTRPA